MRFLFKLERHFGWLAFPGFLRYFAILDAMVFVLGAFNPKLGPLLVLDWPRVAQGEYWRVATGIFAASGFGPGINLLIALIFKYFMVRILFLFNDSLEGAWGVFRLSVFCYVGIAGAMAATLLLPGIAFTMGWLFYVSVFFAFATLFPRVEFRLFLVLPVQVRFVALLIAIPLLWRGLSSGLWWGVLGLVFANYLLWAGIPALRGQKTALQAVARRRKFKTAQMPAHEGIYRCAVCDRTDASHPDLEFRVAADGKDYCQDHLPDPESAPERR
jgi:hypothetical protein